MPADLVRRIHTPCMGQKMSIWGSLILYAKTLLRPWLFKRAPKIFSLACEKLKNLTLDVQDLGTLCYFCTVKLVSPWVWSQHWTEDCT